MPLLPQMALLLPTLSTPIAQEDREESLMLWRHLLIDFGFKWPKQALKQWSKVSEELLPKVVDVFVQLVCAQHSYESMPLACGRFLKEKVQVISLAFFCLTLKKSCF